ACRAGFPPGAPARQQWRPSPSLRGPDRHSWRSYCGHPLPEDAFYPLGIVFELAFEATAIAFCRLDGRFADRVHARPRRKPFLEQVTRYIGTYAQGKLGKHNIHFLGWHRLLRTVLLSVRRIT